MKIRNAFRSSLTARVGLGAIALTLAGSAMAQTATPAATGASDQQAADIIVTGSRIRGIAPVGSNVISITPEKIAQEPVTSTNDLLRRVPQVISLGANRAGGSAQNGAANATRGAGINLRGLSTNATLLLLDGKRFPPAGTQGQFTDPAVIPAIALERVEVVADGASAIYGSDAIAGVVNLILRKNFDGIEARARYGFTDGSYNEKQVAIVAGHKWDGGSAMISGEWTRNNPLFGSQLSFYQNDNRPNGGRDYRNTNCAPGTITAGGNTYAIPASGVTPATSSSLVAGTRNLCFYGGADPVILAQDRKSVVGSVSQNIGSAIRIFADGFYSYRSGQVTVAPNVTANVPSTNPFFVSPVPGATSVTVTTSLFPTTGLLYNPYHADSWNVSGGAEAKIGRFRATAYYAHGESSEIAYRNRSGVNAGALAAALADTNPATALNLFGGPNNPSTIAKITDNLFLITGRTRLDVLNGQIDGPLFSLPGGEVRIAAGGEHRKEYTFTDLTTGQAATPVSVHDAGSRNVDAVFGELFIPIVGANNAMTMINSLSLSAALRYEKYSDFGSTTNPKLGVTYQPLSGLTLKATYGTSFRAPTFTEVSTIAGGAGLYFDTLPGPASPTQIGIGIAGGNPNLKPETAKTWSFGAEAAPRGIPGLLATLNYFRIDYTNQIQALRGTAGLLTNPLYASFVQFNPTPAQVAALVNSGLPLNAAINQSQVTFIADGRRQNLGTSLLRGIDFGLSYNWHWGDIKLDASFQGTYLTKYLFRAVPGAALTDVLGTYGFTQRYRHQADLGLAWQKFHSRITWNHTSGYANNSVTPVQPVKAYDTVDAFIGYDLTKNINLSFDVRNLLDRNPPFVDVVGGYDPQAANPIPRLFSVTATVKF